MSDTITIDPITKDLMLHIERIVRPIRASQRRKLRMRTELLAHAESAFEQEKQTSSNATAALNRAMQRLGDPSELTRQLQQSVPWLQRILNAKTSDKVNRLEDQLGAYLGMRHSVTFLHSLLLLATGAIAIMAIWNFSPHIPASAQTALFVNEIDHPGRAKTVLIAAWFLQMAWFYVGLRFLFDAAAPVGRFRLPPVIVTAFLALLLQALLMCLIVTKVLNRAPTTSEMTQSLGVGALALTLCVLAARLVASLRRPYDEWLTLDLT